MAARAHRSEVAGDSDRSPDYLAGCNHSGPGRCEAGDGRTIAAGPVSSWAGEPVPGLSGLVGQRRYGLDAAAGPGCRPRRPAHNGAARPTRTTPARVHQPSWTTRPAAIVLPSPASQRPGPEWLQPDT